MGAFDDPASALWHLRARYPQWWRASDPAKADPRPWPPGFDPRRGPVYGRNEGVIHAPPEAVFRLLSTPSLWPTFYPNCPDAEALDGETLRLGARFRWTTFGTKQTSQVTTFDPPHSIAWDAKGGGAWTHHRWFLTREGDATRVLTEEIETGIVPSLGRWVMRPALHTAHQLWIEGMRETLVETSPLSA